MPSTPTSRLGLQAPLLTEDADGPALSNLLINQLEPKVGMIKIAEVVPVGGLITFSSIPAAYRHLKIMGVARGNGGPVNQGGTFIIKMKFNGVVGDVGYWSRRIQDTTGGQSTTYDANGIAYLNAGDLQDETSTGIGFSANDISSHEIDIFAYRDSVNKMVHARSTKLDNIAGSNVVIQSFESRGRWVSTAAITSIVLTASELDPAGTTIDGMGFQAAVSRFSLYGIG